MSVPADLHAVVQSARSIAARGHLRQAAGMLEEALESTTASLGVDHPEVLAATRLLARLHTDLGELSEARRILEESLAAGHYRLGEDHPIMLGLAYDLALLADELGNLHEARRNYGLLARLGPGVLGPGHEYVTAARGYLGLPAEPAVDAVVPAPTEPPADVPEEIPAALTAPPPVDDAPTQVLTPVPWRPPSRAPGPPAGEPTGPEAPPPRSAPPIQPAQPTRPASPTQPAQPTHPVPAPRPALSPRYEQQVAEPPRPRFGAPPPPPRYEQLAALPVERIELPPLPGDDDPLDDRTDARPGRAPLLILVAIAIMALLGGGVAAVAVFRTGGADRAGSSAPSSAATEPAEPSGAPAAAPTGLSIRDSGTSVTLSWADPTAAQVAFLVAGGQPGQLRPVGQTVAGDTTFTLQGLNPKLEYCFTVGAVYDVNQVALSDLVCTQRTTRGTSASAPPSPAR